MKPHTTSDERRNYFSHTKLQVEFNGSYLKSDKVIWLYYVDKGFKLRNSLFGAINLTKNSNLDKHFYPRFDILFYVRRTSSLPNSGFC